MALSSRRARMSGVERVPYDADLWRRMEPVWRELLERTEEPSAFLSAAWVGAWVDVFGSTCRPTGLVWRDDQESPVACVLISNGTSRYGPFPVRRSFLNASGGGPGCEHNDVLVLPECREAVLDEIVRIVRRGGCDELALVGMREEATQALRSRWPSPWFEGHFSEAPYVALESIRAGGTPYLATLSSNVRSQIRRSIRLYEGKFGKISLGVARAGDETKDWLAEMLLLHEERWTKKGLPGAFADEQTRRFHARILECCTGPTGPDRLGTELLRIRFGEETVGILYNLTYRGRVSFYQSGLRYHDDNRLKPGLVAHSVAVERYLGLGRGEYDFLGGEPEAVRYKRSLSTDIRTLAWIQLPAPSLKMRLLRSLRVGRRRLRSALKASR